MSRSLLVIAGEVSGDMHAARVIKELQKRTPDIQVWGVGGEELRACGVEILYDVKDMAVMGLAEVLKRYGFFKKAFNHVLSEAKNRRPDAVLLVDYPGFNLRFAQEAKRAGLKVIYYICPQVWAWHRSRIQKIANIVDHLLVIFPFEVDVFAETGLKVDFVGHPLIDRIDEAPELSGQELPWRGEKHLALLPGSRKQEIQRILPAMLEAAKRVKRKLPDTGIIVASPSEQISQYILKISKNSGLFTVVTGGTQRVLRQAQAAMVTSGTATLETALIGCPMVVVYKTSWLTYLLGRLVIRIPFIGMVNIIAGRQIVPELIQHKATPAAIEKAIVPLLTDRETYDQVKKDLREVKIAMGNRGAASHAASHILEDMG